MDEEQEVEEVTTEEHETNSDTEGEATERDVETGDSDKTYTQAELDTRIKEQDKRWKDRIKDGKKGTKESSKDEVSDEKWLRTDLKADGIKEPKEQDIILKYIRDRKASGEEVTTTDAQKSMVVREDIAKLRSNNIPPPSTRTSGAPNDSYDYYVKNIKAGKLRLTDVKDSAMKQRLMNGKIFG